MVMGKEIASAALLAFALLAGPGGKADAAQCGSSAGGFESWKQEFAAEAKGKGVGANAAAALMQTNYASATIAADRSQRSFSLSLDQFLAKRGATTIVARGRSLKQSQGALFASIQQRYGVPPGPLLAIWGMETGFGSQRGNQNMLSSIATLAYDCRRQEYFTEQLYAALKLIDRGVLSAPRAAPCTARSAKPSSCRRTSWPMAPAISRSPPMRSTRRRIFSRPWLARRRRLPAGRGQFRRDPGLERRRRLSESHRADGPPDRWRRMSGGAVVLGAGALRGLRQHRDMIFNDRAERASWVWKSLRCASAPIFGR